MRCAMRLLSGLMSTTGIALLGCSNVLDIPDDPMVIEPTGPWSCLGDTPAAATPTEATARVMVSVCNFVDNCATPVTGLTVSACAKKDVNCTNPLVSDVMDDNGMITLDVPIGTTGFDGYLQIDSMPALCTDEQVFGAAGAMLCGLSPSCDPMNPTDDCLVPTFAPALLFMNPPVTADLQQPLGLPLLPSAALPSIVQAAGAQLDPTTGNLFITAVDCDGNTSAGVTYSISQASDQVTQLYVDNGVVSDTVFETDRSGIGGFVGVPPGFAEVVGTNAEQQRIGKIGVLARPFTLTYSALVPSD